IRVAHYPPYCSKHNPIEHQVFPHITRACQGVIFHTVDIAQQCIERAKTTTGLRVTVRRLDKVYQAGRKYAADFKQNMKILFDDHLPKWNYSAVPACTRNRELIFDQFLTHAQTKCLRDHSYTPHFSPCPENPSSHRPYDPRARYWTL